MSFDVSIIVPVYGQWKVTRNCLNSLQVSSRSSKLKAEILLADDASPEAIPADLLKAYKCCPWELRHLLAPDNRGFLENCNAAAVQARGKYICFLNNDVIVPPDWLDRLHTTIESNSGIGIVGALLLNPDGSVQEFGCSVLSDGSTIMLGRNEKPGRHFDFINEVDYVSGACLLITTALFREIGGFDERYAPSYYEDTDLCFEAAKRGYKVVVDPGARVVHLAHKTHGSDHASTMSGINRVKFYDKWKQILPTSQPDLTTKPGRLRTWKRKGTYFVHYNTVKEGKDSATLRCLNMIRGLRSRGYHVVLVYRTVTSRQLLYNLQKEGVEILRVQKPPSTKVARILADYEPTAAIFSFAATEEAYAPLYRKYSPKTLRLFDAPDLAFVRKIREEVHALGFEGTLSPSPLTLRNQDYRELFCALRSDGMLTVTEIEKKLLADRFHLPPDRVSVFSSIHEADAASRPFEEREGFVYLGHFNFEPNLDAVRWLSGKIWPEIRRLLPSAQLRIYGSYMPDEIKLLHNPDKGLWVEGYVGDHLEAIRSSRAMLVPLRFGAGLKGKVIESLSTGTPVVTTAIGAEGIDSEGKVLRLSEDVAEFARMAVELHEKKEIWNHHSSLGLPLVANRFSAAGNMDRLERFIENLNVLKRLPDSWAMMGRMIWILSDKNNVLRFSWTKVPSFLWHQALQLLKGRKNLH